MFSTGQAFQLCCCFLQGYMLKKGHKRKNWTERWFVLKPNIISYYVSEDLKDKKGDIILDGNCCVEVKDKQKTNHDCLYRRIYLFFFCDL